MRSHARDQRAELFAGPRPAARPEVQVGSTSPVRLWVVRCVVVVAAALLSTGGAAAQTRGTLRGVVTDDLGYPQFPVTVVLVNSETEVERPAVTDGEGGFVFGGLRPGRYVVRVEADGYLPFVSDAVAVAAAVEATLAVVLELAAPPEFAAPAERTPDYIPVPSRWRTRYRVTPRYPAGTEGVHPPVAGRALDPYNQNPLKGDVPVAGDDLFFVLTVLSQTPFEYREAPTPAGASTERPGSEAFFGDGGQWAALPTTFVSAELFRGDTAFRPRDWAVRVTPAFNLNHNVFRERNALDVDPAHEAVRTRRHATLQEAFGEVKLFDVGPSYDFVSVRAGIQPFSSDFRGFLFRDVNLGVRGFGNWGRNRHQWNVAWFDQLEKKTNSELNTLHRRDQQVFVANWYRQDTFTLGYTVTASFHMNLDRGGDLFYDENGFLVRPAPIGVVAPHEVRAYYAGFGGDGHWGRLNLTHQFYQAWGVDELNGIAGRAVDIDARFAAVELSVDRDWYRLKGTFLYASGDGDPFDGTARGFDAIFDEPNVAGGPFAFWNREGLRTAQTLVGLVGRKSVLPSMRTSKTEGQANFVNPGLLMYGAGFDAELTRKLRLFSNVTLLRFDRTDVLRAVLFQRDIDEAIGIDYGAGVEYRPWLNDNVVIQGGASWLAPAGGFGNILTDGVLYTPFAVLTLKY